MTYELGFKASALKEWQKLGHTVREQFKRTLAERLHNPHVPAAALSGASNEYTIKLRKAGYRLVYAVEDHIITVKVIAVGKRERNAVYEVALGRLKEK